MSGHCLLPFSYSEIRLLFLLDGKAIRLHVFSYFIYVCLDDHQWKNLLEIMLKIFWIIILNFWNMFLKRENRIFAGYPSKFWTFLNIPKKNSLLLLENYTFSYRISLEIFKYTVVTCKAYVNFFNIVFFSFFLLSFWFTHTSLLGYSLFFVRGPKVRHTCSDFGWRLHISQLKTYG